MTYPAKVANERRPGHWSYVGADNGDQGDDDEYIYVPSFEELSWPDCEEEFERD